MMEKTNEKKCPNCESIDLIEIKVEKREVIIGSNLGQYPDSNKIIYHCKCKKCDTQFEYWPEKDN